MQNEFFNELINDNSTSINNIVLLNLKKLSMTPDEFTIYAVLEMYSQKNTKFPAPELIENVTGLSQGQIMSIIQSLIKKNIISIKTQINQNHQQQDAYDLTSVYYQLAEIFNTDKKVAEQSEKKNKVRDLFKMIEIEFGRPMSPIEQETVHDWLNQSHYDIELIKLALKEAVLNQAYSLKYMDRILLNWEKQNIKTTVQLEDFKRRNEF